MKKILLIIVILITSLGYSQVVKMGNSTVGGGAKGDKGDMPSFTINGTTVTDGSSLVIAGDSNSFLPQTYGVVGDGVTDDTAAFQAMFDAVETAGGGSVFIPRATYMINYNGINVKSNTIVDGGDATLKLIPNSIDGGSVLRVVNVENIKISNLNVYGDKSQHSYINTYTVNVAPTSGTKINLAAVEVDAESGKTIKTFNADIAVSLNDLATIKSEILTAINTDPAFADYTATLQSGNTYVLEGQAGVYTVWTLTTDTNLNTARNGDLFIYPYGHAAGLGVYVSSSKNVFLENVKSFDCTGDSFTLGHLRESYFSFRDVTGGGVVRGGFDASGVIDDATYTGYRTATPFTLSIINTEYFHFWARQFGGNYDNSNIVARIFYYDVSDVFLESRDFNWQEHYEKTSDIPIGATKAHVWYVDAPVTADTSETKIELGGGIFQSRNITLKNFEAAGSRRQGITVGGVIGLTIADGKIHHINGIAPQSGIDIEEGVNRYIEISNIVFEDNVSNFQSPSGNFVTINNCTFKKTINNSSFSSDTGSVNMNDCVILNSVVALGGKSYIKNTTFFNCTISGSSNVYSYNKKVFDNCTFKNTVMSALSSSAGAYFGLVTFNNGVFENTSLAGDKNIVYNNAYLQNITGNIGGYFNNCKIEFTGSLSFLTYSVFKNTEIERVSEPTANTGITFGIGVKMENSKITDLNTSFLGNISIQDNVEILNTTFDIIRNLVFGYSGFAISGTNVIFNNNTINHTGTIAGNSALVWLSGTGNTTFYKNSFKTNAVTPDYVVEIVGGTPTYDLFQNILIGVTQPIDDATNRLGGNIQF